MIVAPTFQSPVMIQWAMKTERVTATTTSTNAAYRASLECGRSGFLTAGSGSAIVTAPGSGRGPGCTAKGLPHCWQKREPGWFWDRHLEQVSMTGLH